MPPRLPETSSLEQRSRALVRALKGGLGVLAGLLVLIWALLPLVPAGTGLKFGWIFRLFFTAMVLLGALFFWFLGKERIAQPKSPAAVLASLAAVSLATVALLVAAGVVYPQFPRPRPPEVAAKTAADRGKELFTSSSIGCYRCHTVAGSGGTRGPDLSQVAARAGSRVSSLAAREYLLAKLKAGSTYEFKVPSYAPAMPPFSEIATEQQIEDLVAYLLTLK